MAGNGVDDNYKKDRQPRILASNLCARNWLVDKCHNETAFRIVLMIVLNEQECDKSRRQKKGIYFK